MPVHSLPKKAKKRLNSDVFGNFAIHAATDRLLVTKVRY